jgi:hypothetical protein
MARRIRGKNLQNQDAWTVFSYMELWPKSTNAWSTAWRDRKTGGPSGGGVWRDFSWFLGLYSE